MSLSRWTVKQTVVRLHREMRFSDKKERTIDSCNLDGLKGITLSEKGHTLHDSVYVTLSELYNCRNGEQIRGCEGLDMVGGRVAGETKWRHEGHLRVMRWGRFGYSGIYMYLPRFDRLDILISWFW